MLTTTFWKSTLERAIKTFAQSLIATIGVGAAAPVWELGWTETLGIALTATLLSVLTSLASVGAANPGTPSLVNKPSENNDATLAGAEAATLAGYPTANPDEPLMQSQDGSSRHEAH